MHPDLPPVPSSSTALRLCQLLPFIQARLKSKAFKLGLALLLQAGTPLCLGLDANPLTVCSKTAARTKRDALWRMRSWKRLQMLPALKRDIVLHRLVGCAATGSSSMHPPHVCEWKALQPPRLPVTPQSGSADV